MDISADDKEKDTEGQKIAKAEVVEFKGREWSRKSVQSMDEVEAKIDRFSGKGVKGLSDRYRDKYGEDLKVPELYQIETTIEMEREFDTESDDEELARIDKELEAAPVKDENSSFFGRKKDKAKVKVEFDEDKPVLEPKLLDFSSAVFFLMKRFGARGGGIKKILLALLDVGLILFFPLTIIRILTTIVIVMKRKKARKINSVSAADA
jgi:hypothetical protein